uniref:Autophagy protein 5 n=1 Tax=Amphora coffeiformis TaxID=265554 RepID=A0A7S3L4H0_9STRA|mmetsp:Transcript_2993/g.5960  ORF Transcript_2993/g.5960 Transcript_2993/m.5960 type:complete len:318 (-) Transcript_2993:23-976(-)|eukprot:scaffold22432_cov168-Amphora_coffeaeformis.AAC.1
MPLHSDELHSENWAGSVAVVLTLAANSNSSPSLPPPIHVMIPRHSFLHVALEDAVRRLHKFAPPTFFFGGIRREEPQAGSMYKDEEDVNENTDTSTQAKPSTMTLQKEEDISYPVCWFEDEDTQTALRWHVFAGVLYDLKRRPEIPWKIRLHFTSYPSSQILALERADVLHHVRSVFKNSLKQAMCLHYGNAKPALNLTKESHGKIWEALRTANYQLYKQAHSSLPKQSSIRIPVRVLVNAGPPIQKPCLGADHLTLVAVLHAAAPDHFDPLEGAKPSVLDWKVAGISKLPLDTLIQNCWVNLAHPDHFLYIIVHTE